MLCTSKSIKLHLIPWTLLWRPQNNDWFNSNDLNNKTMVIFFSSFSFSFLSLFVLVWYFSHRIMSPLVMILDKKNYVPLFLLAKKCSIISELEKTCLVQNFHITFFWGWMLTETCCFPFSHRLCGYLVVLKLVLLQKGLENQANMMQSYA